MPGEAHRELDLTSGPDVPYSMASGKGGLVWIELLFYRGPPLLYAQQARVMRDPGSVGLSSGYLGSNAH